MSSLHEGGRPTARRSAGIPGSVWAATGFWLLFALVSFFAAGDSLAADNRDPEVNLVASQLGPGAVGAKPAVATSGPIAIVVGVVTLSLVLLVLSRRGWSRFALVSVGAFGANRLAWDARWEVIPAFGLLFLGSVALMLPASHRFSVPDERPPLRGTPAAGSSARRRGRSLAPS